MSKKVKLKITSKPDFEYFGIKNDEDRINHVREEFKDYLHCEDDEYVGRVIKLKKPKWDTEVGWNNGIYIIACCQMAWDYVNGEEGKFGDPQMLCKAYRLITKDMPKTNRDIEGCVALFRELIFLD